MLSKNVRDIFKGVLYCSQFGLLGHLFLTYGYTAGGTYGVSMTPTIQSGEWLVISKKYRRGRGLKVGDLVSFKNPVMTEIGERTVKRVVGMPGDFVMRYTPGAGTYGQEAMIQVRRKSSSGRARRLC